MNFRVCRSTEALHVRKTLVQVLYETYETLVEDAAFACDQECSACCTHNVLATTAEVDLLMDFIAEIDRPELIVKMQEGTPGRRMQARITVNDLAAYCLRREDPPDPVHSYDIAPCPLREPDGCPVYPARPFVCRSLWSNQRCHVGGAADPDPVVLTLNGVFEQLIEHADAGGLAGNMIDLFDFLSDRDVRAAYRGGSLLEASNRLLTTKPNPGLLVPPEHRPAVLEALNALDKREVHGLPFRQAMKALRTEEPSQPNT